MCMLKVCSTVCTTYEVSVPSSSAELDDDDPDVTTVESPETTVLAAEDASLDTPPTPTKVHAEPSA
jgi:hypothetical protein